MPQMIVPPRAPGLGRPRSGVDGEGLSLPPRVEVTKKYALAYGRASRKDKSRIQINAIQQELTRAASLKTL